VSAGVPSSAGPGAPGLSSQDLGLLVLLALAWGSAYVFIREGILLGAGPLPFAAIRYALSAAAFFAIAAARREAFPDRASLLASAAIGGTLVIGLYGGFLYVGEQFTTGGYASVLSATAPILTVVVAYGILPAERLSLAALAGIGIGFAGAVVLVGSQISGGTVGTSPGPELVIAAFVSTAIGTVLLRRYGRGRQGLWQIGAEFAVGAVLLGVGTAVLPVSRSLPLGPGVLESLAALVLLSSVVGYFVYFLLHHRVGPVRANVVAYLLPPVGIAIGTGVFGEPVSEWEVVGFLIVVVGVTLVIRERSRIEPVARDAA
jgi:drug/metabolite transporter (DMT)-like permease